MPLSDLEALGYTVSYPPEGIQPPMGVTVWGYDRQWSLQPGQDEEDLVAMATNHHAIYTKLEQARDYFGGNYADWGTLTAQQKDTANRQAQRALANIARFLLNDLATGGD